MTLAIMVHRVGWTEVTDSSIYGAPGLLDGTD